MSLAEKLHPDRFTAMGPKMTAIVAYPLRGCTGDLLYTKVIDERAG